ncbi:MAG TPA: aminodeoxychorismate/anthranilate synthase component II [Desulfobacteraceae bacterium]|nr:aminodeoxychorismate/anthranilate synthase component II [Desulfobacteraceae bacterium]
MIVMIDNYDSFTYNLVQYLEELGADVQVLRNDVCTLEELVAMNPAGLVISPGPGGPGDAGISVKAIKEFSDKIPILGVCLGHQSIAAAFGCEIVPAKRIMHGKTSKIYSDGSGLYKGIDSPFTAMRYHSLAVSFENFSDCLIVTSKTKDGEIMGIRHKENPTEGIQFHPESIMTPSGMHLLSNFLKLRNEDEIT